MLIGLLCALVAALAYGSATILQALGVSAQKEKQSRRGALLYAVGLALDGVGFLVSIIALHSLPLFLVQSVIASSVAVTAVLAVLVLKARLVAREIVALGVVALGLVLLAASAQDGPPRQTPGWLTPTLFIAAALAGALFWLGWAKKNGPLLALTAGVGFSGVAIAARILSWDGGILDLVREPLVWALALHGLIALVAYAFALDVGTVTTVAAISFAVETLLPAAIGLAALGDEVRPHTAPLAALGFVAALGGCIALAGQSEPASPTA